MRLLFLSNVHPHPYSPGKGTFNAAMVQSLADEHRLRVMCPVSWLEKWRGTRSDRFGEHDFNQILGRGVIADFPTFWYPPKLFRSRFHHWLAWSLRNQLERVRDSFQPEAILSYWAHPDGTTAVQTARRWGIPSVVMVGGSDVLLLTGSSSRRRVILNTLHEASAVVCVSADIATQLQKQGIAARKLHVVRRGVDQALFHPGDQTAARNQIGAAPESRILVGVGRHVPVKRWDLLLQSLQLAKQQMPTTPIELHLCGDGPLRESLTAQATRLGLGDIVRFRGNVSQTQLGDYYRAADLVVLCSDSEGVPNVLQEAIASGTRFVSTDVGGVAEIADPVHDRIVPPGNAAALSGAILEQLWTTPSTTQRQYEPLSWADSATEITRILESCVAPDRTHRAVAATPDLVLNGTEV